MSFDLDENPKLYSKIGWCLVAAVLIVILISLPVIEVVIGPSMIYIEIIAVFVILGISGWHLLRTRE